MHFRYTYALALVVLAARISAIGPSVALAERPRLTIVSRKQWHALPLPELHKKQEVTGIIIHHTGTDFPALTTDRYLQNIQRWARNERGWSDIPYHYMIDSNGHIFQTLPDWYPGSTNTNYDPRDKIHIAIIGDFRSTSPDPAALQALESLLIKVRAQYHLPVETIQAHTTLAATDCPGEKLVQELRILTGNSSPTSQPPSG